jgi:hypothetical protein
MRWRPAVSKPVLREVKSDSFDELQQLDSTPLTEEDRKRRDEARKAREAAERKRKLLNG